MTQVIEWRFGGMPGDEAAWHAAPAQAHVYVDIRTPETPPEHWHRTWAVTRSWVKANIASSQSAIVPPLLMVADGSPAELRQQVDELVQSGWSLIVRSAALIAPGHVEGEW